MHYNTIIRISQAVMIPTARHDLDCRDGASERRIFLSDLPCCRVVWRTLCTYCTDEIWICRPISYHTFAFITFHIGLIVSATIPYMLSFVIF